LDNLLPILNLKETPFYLLQLPAQGSFRGRRGSFAIVGGYINNGQTTFSRGEILSDLLRA
jgi:hypothetical protein